MKRALVTRLMEREDSRLVFMTGDVGFNLLEPLEQQIGPRFINAGIAEQNMVGASAGLADTGLRPWVYTIAPFLYARAFEQIRNDICFPNRPVTLVGAGGGYGYGVMGPSHHALEDYGVLCTLPNMTCYIPAFASDIPEIVDRQMGGGPAYIRLGTCEKPHLYNPATFTQWRRVQAAGKKTPIRVVCGPLAGRMVFEPSLSGLWILSQLPIIPEDIPEELWDCYHLTVTEEHVPQGGAGMQLLDALHKIGHPPRVFTRHCALGYPSGTYGSQDFHRRESSLV